MPPGVAPPCSLEVVCPSCDGLLTLTIEENGGLAPGAPLAVFCPGCEKHVEVTAPKGIQALGKRPADRAASPPASEFAAARLPETGS